MVVEGSIVTGKATITVRSLLSVTGITTVVAKVAKELCQ